MEINNLRNMYSGQSCFLICDGPSFKNVDKSILKREGVITMGVNNSPASFRPNLWCAVDSPNNFIRSIFTDGLITKFVPNAYRKQYSSPVIGFTTNTDYNPQRFLSESSISYGCTAENGGGRSVMMAAIKLLYMLGFKNVFLLGVDFSMTKGDDNYHFEQDTNDHCVRVNNNTYVKLIRRFRELKPIFDGNDFNIYNCNKDSKLEVFPYISIEEAVSSATHYMPDINNEKTDGMYDKGWVRKKNGERGRRQKRRGNVAKKARERMAKSEIENTIAKNQIAITGISRSGTHAVSDWICNQLDGHVEWRNDLARKICNRKIFDPNDEIIPERWYKLPSINFKDGIDHTENIDHLVYTYENQNGDRFKLHPRVKSESGKRVVLLRDPYNLLASLCKHVEDGHKFWFWRMCTDDGVINPSKLKNFTELWLSHARQYKADGNIGISYNRWKVDKLYRDELFSTLELSNRSDDSMSKVPVNGGGSSFDKRSMNGHASEMDNNNRWFSIKDETWFNEFISNNQELVNVSKEIFGDILNG